jgi:metal-responsive CopG/Arc/MetJ family transcriptional regulator
MRILIDIPDERLAEIDVITAIRGISRLEFVRRSLEASLVPYRKSDATDAFGILKGRWLDGVVFQNKLRDEW